MQPWLADGWTPGKDGRTLTIKIRPNVMFHDGTILDAAALATLLPGVLQSMLGPVFSDFESVTPSGNNSVQIQFRKPSPFLLESLDATIQKSGAIGTGPFKAAKDSTTEMLANANYHLGQPAIQQIHVQTFPSVRAAWADMLRQQIDMLWEVGTDALDSMKSSSTVSVFTYTRRYQFVIALNPKSPLMKSKEVRRALNMAIDRDALVRNALNTYGVASAGPVSPFHWALPPKPARFEFDPKAAAQALAVAKRGSTQTDRLRFTCLVPPDSVNERVALDVKRQLEGIDVDMEVKELTQDQILERLGRGDYDAALIEFISAPTLLRPYLVWHSGGPFNWGNFGDSTIDEALDKVRYSDSDDSYRTAVADLLRTFVEDPPGIFLAWPIRARAVSKHFLVPAEPGRDIIGTLRLWKPATDVRQASRN